MQYRAAKIDAAKSGARLSGADPGRFSFALTSEEPVRRWFGDEILNHNASNVRTGRLDSGMVPLLFNHDPNMHLGRVDKYELKNGVLRVEGQFGTSALAQEKRADYDTGVLNAASGGYRVHKVLRTEDHENPDAPDRVDVTDWEPFDASLVTVPADPTVGVGRSESGQEEFQVFVETRAAREHTGDTKKVDGVELPKDCFAYTPDDVPSHWEFPLHFPGDDAKTKEHIEKAVQLFPLAKLPDTVKAHVWAQIVAAAKAHGVKIDGKDADHPDNATVPEKRGADSSSARPVIEIQPEQEKRTMAETATNTNQAEMELARRDAIMAVAADKDFGKYFTVEDAQRAIKDGTTADAVKDTVTRKIIDANDVAKVGTLADHTFAQATRKEQRAYSLTNLIRSLVNEKSRGTFKGEYEAKLEREMSDELGKRLGLSTTGCFVPMSALTRALGTQAIVSGSGQIALTSEAAAVQTITRPEVIELLRNRPRCLQLGAQVLGGLQGIVRLPRQTGAGSWQWLGEGAAVSPADLSMDFVSVQPHRGSTQSAVDIELLASTSPDVEGLMRADFNKIRNLALDYAALNGPVGGAGPVGLLNASGLATLSPTGTVSQYTTAKMLSWADITNFEEIPAAADADVATSGWMVTPGIRQALKSTPMFAAGYAQPIWNPQGGRDPLGLEDGPMGYKAGVTNQLPQNGALTGYTGPGLHTAIFGDWSQLIFADWGAVEVIYDPYTQAGNGAIVLTMRSLHDNAIRHIAAFVAATKIATS